MDVFSLIVGLCALQEEFSLCVCACLQRVGVSNLYNHFKGKNGIFTERALTPYATDFFFLFSIEVDNVFWVSRFYFEG